MEIPPAGHDTSSARAPSRLRASIYMDAAPVNFSYEERFKLLARAGFEGAEILAVADQTEASRMHEAALRTNMKIHSVSNAVLWRYPLTSRDPKELGMAIRSTMDALENARRVGADTLLMVPGIVNRTTSYTEAYTRSQHVIRTEILPAAREYGIVIGIENVWNGFLLSPLEYVRYIDEFETPSVRAYLDVGNIFFGQVEDWVRIAGSRIVKMHVKDFRFKHRNSIFHHGRNGSYAFGRIGQGAIAWDRVRTALAEVGYSGWVTAAELWHGVMARGLNRGAAILHRRGLDRAPLLRPALCSLQKAMTLPSLRDANRRIDQFLR